MGQRLYLQLFRNRPDLGRFCTQELRGSTTMGGNGGAAALLCPLAVPAWLGVGGCCPQSPHRHPVGLMLERAAPPGLKLVLPGSSVPFMSALAPSAVSSPPQTSLTTGCCLTSPSHLEAFPGQGRPGEEE